MSKGPKLKAGDRLKFINAYISLYDENCKPLDEVIGRARNAIFLGETKHFSYTKALGIKVLTAKGISWQIKTDFQLADQERMTNLEEFWQPSDHAIELVG